MMELVKRGRALIDEINRCECPAPTLWWLGHSGFAVKYRDIVFYIDPCLSEIPGRVRTLMAPLRGEQIDHADLILCTHRHQDHMDEFALSAILRASARAKVVLPKSTAEYAHSIGIPYDRMTTTDAHLRVEYFKGNLYGRVYAAPSAHPELEWTPLGGYPYLGYLIRFGEWTLYHAGDCSPYEGLADELRPYNVSLALLPIGGPESPGNFQIAEAADLAKEIGARWLAPMHYGTFEPAVDVNRFIEHMLGHRPEQRFKVFQCGEGWAIPED